MIVKLRRHFLFLALFALAAASRVSAEVELDANFHGGNIIVDKIQGDVVTLHQDRRDTKDWWFYWCFRVRGAAGRTLTFNFTDGAVIGVRGPAVSFDEGATWKWLGPQADTKSFTFTFPATASAARFSFGMPYTEANLKAFLSRVGSNRALKLETLCRSRKDRTVERLRVGKISGEPRFRALVTCRAHCCEMMTSYVAEGLIEAALGMTKMENGFRKTSSCL